MSQNYANHTRWVPPYHFVAGPIFLLNVGWSIYRLVKVQSAETVIALLVAIALLILFLFSRLFTITVQDRVIRLEMQLRMASVLPADMRSRIPEFTVDQLVSLRFTSDAELPALARKVLDEKINDRTVIKKQIKNWQADDLRA
jgi:regulator of protease activity HflC (stomatin/prohibitin superfamily)